MGESSCQEPPQAWKCLSKPWPTNLSWNRPKEGGPSPAITPNFASCTGPRPCAMQNTIEDSARALKSLIHTPILRMNGFMRNDSILMRILLGIRGTMTDPLPLFSVRMGRRFLDIEAEHQDIEADRIQERTVVGRRAEHLLQKQRGHCPQR